MKINIYLMSLLYVIPVLLYGQKSFNNNFYSVHPYSYNMAYASEGKDFNVALQFAGENSGLTSSPRTTSLFLSKGLLRNAGLGLRLMVDKRGIFTDTRVMVESGYTVVINPLTSHFMRLGISGGVNFESLNLSRIAENGYSDMEDPMLYASSSRSSDIQFGGAFVYQLGGFDIGVSAPFLVSLYRAERDKAAFWKYLAVSAGYIFQASDKIRLRPLFMGQYTPPGITLADIALLIEWDRQFLMKIGYRSNNSLLSTVGLWVGSALVGYALEVPFGDYRSLAGAQHSVMLRFAVNEKLLGLRKRVRHTGGFVPGQGKKDKKNK